MKINAPTSPVMEGLRTGRTWVNFFSNVANLITAMASSGTTAQRPTSFLYIGRVYYDVTLQKPIWYNGTVWKDAAGTTV